MFLSMVGMYEDVRSRNSCDRSFTMITYVWVQNRWEGLLKNGRRVIAVGDFNISPFPIDSCHSDSNPDFDKSSYVFIPSLVLPCELP